MELDPLAQPDELRQAAMTKPTSIDPLAEEVLVQLSGKSAASEIILGGYFALQHYADYPRTHDIDAWWKTVLNPQTEEAIREAMQQVANVEGFTLHERRFGEPLSLELVRDGRREFSFQISVRSVTLEEPLASAWPPLLIKTLADNVGSKMNAPVDRGAPRDFMDVKHVVDTGLMTAARCWELWRRKNPGGAVEASKQKALLHLVGLESRRPLESIQDAGERERARMTREWFRQEFIKP